MHAKGVYIPRLYLRLPTPIHSSRGLYKGSLLLGPSHLPDFWVSYLFDLSRVPATWEPNPARNDLAPHPDRYPTKENSESVQLGG